MGWRSGRSWFMRLFGSGLREQKEGALREFLVFYAVSLLSEGFREGEW